MSLDEPFPLDHLPRRLQNVVLKKFDGRCPSQREVADIPDAQWLATPEFGHVSLRQIRALVEVIYPMCA
ncbi:hypothetical protein MicloDRAFT_00031330 [Microvirga lotononidis]|uniref:Uncharacterized protein n=1 Tax=Microvirga lotononidis TaxID=864069 RepID=I4YRJ2_9HYPH|nr:hypothetical protein MicloDRAFT_00031330 [Microvirga lotononidis]